MRKYKTRLMRKHRPRKEMIEHLEEQVLHPEPSRKTSIRSIRSCARNVIR